MFRQVTVYTCIINIHQSIYGDILTCTLTKRSHPLFTSNHALSALRCRRVSHPRLSLSSQTAFFLSVVSDMPKRYARPYISCLFGIDWNMPLQVSMKKLVPVNTRIYLNVRNRLVLSRWWGFQSIFLWYHDILWYTQWVQVYSFDTILYCDILGKYKYFSFAQCFPCLWPSLVIFGYFFRCIHSRGKSIG
jgi:hypothetical protein